MNIRDKGGAASAEGEGLRSGMRVTLDHKINDYYDAASIRNLI